jgi:hypothetical protein
MFLKVADTKKIRVRPDKLKSSAQIVWAIVCWTKMKQGRKIQIPKSASSAHCALKKLSTGHQLLKTHQRVRVSSTCTRKYELKSVYRGVAH